MKKRVIVGLILLLFAISIVSSCKSKDCPAYDDFKGEPAASISYKKDINV